MRLIDPADIAEKYLRELQQSVQALDRVPSVTGFIATEDKPSVAYAKATGRTFVEAGIHYMLRQVQRSDIEEEVVKANSNADIHGIFIYFPVFANQEDDHLRNLVDFTKDIEAGSLYWTQKLSANDRLATHTDASRKALIPCTPLAIVKLLDEIHEYGSGDLPMSGKRVTVFNRSEVIGRPLAVMMSNDGAQVFSFDERGPLLFQQGQAQETAITPDEAMKKSDIVITGVPDASFRIRHDQVHADSVCINFSSVENFEENVAEKVRVFVPRVGPMTVAMCIRNTIRLYETFHQ